MGQDNILFFLYVTPGIKSLVSPTQLNGGSWHSFSLDRNTQDKICAEFKTDNSGQLYKPHKNFKSVSRHLVTLDSFSRGLITKLFPHSQPNIWDIGHDCWCLGVKLCAHNFTGYTLISFCALQTHIFLRTIPFCLLFPHFVCAFFSFTHS